MQLPTAVTTNIQLTDMVNFPLAVCLISIPKVVLESGGKAPQVRVDVSGQLYSPSLYPRGNSARYPLDGPQNQSGLGYEDKINTPNGNRT
jgi:hypothetical protein